jgi:SSS family solute:Na+ symporter
VYVGGAGAAIIGGLYWKNGTTAGAWAALATGSVLAGGGIVARQIWRRDFPLNGTEISLCASAAAVIVYAAVFWLTCRRDFDMDRMLHRGVHAP